MKRRRKYQIPAFKLALLAGLLAFLGVAFFGSLALGGALLGVSMVALVYLAWHMGRHGEDATIGIYGEYECPRTDDPCGEPMPGRDANGCGGCAAPNVSDEGNVEAHTRPASRPPTE